MDALAATPRKFTEQHDNIQTIHQDLFDAYGPTMSVQDVAKALRRSASSIRNELSGYERGKRRKEVKWIAHLHNNKMQVGRKVLFRTRVIAELLEAHETESR